MTVNTVKTSLSRTLGNAAIALRDHQPLEMERELGNLIKSARIALLELEEVEQESKLVLKPGVMPLADLAAAWKGYVPTPHNDFADGYKHGADDAADELLDWLRVNNG
jgi:hypothetical protein